MTDEELGSTFARVRAQLMRAITFLDRAVADGDLDVMGLEARIAHPLATLIDETDMTVDDALRTGLRRALEEIVAEMPEATHG